MASTIWLKYDAIIRLVNLQTHAKNKVDILTDLMSENFLCHPAYVCQNGSSRSSRLLLVNFVTSELRGGGDVCADGHTM